jgi:hypothetical protein
MKRDISLVREILLRLEPISASIDEPIPLTVGEPPLDIPGYTNEQIVHHIRLMADGGLISYVGNLSGPGSTRISRFAGLRWQGHEFLDDIRDPDAWEATKKRMAKVGGVSWQIALEIARAYLRAHLPF